MVGMKGVSVRFPELDAIVDEPRVADVDSKNLRTFEAIMEV